MSQSANYETARDFTAELEAVRGAVGTPADCDGFMCDDCSPYGCPTRKDERPMYTDAMLARMKAIDRALDDFRLEGER